MRYALIIAGGSGTRFWPMSRGACRSNSSRSFDGKSLLEIAYQRLEGLVPARAALHLRRRRTRPGDPATPFPG